CGAQQLQLGSADGLGGCADAGARRFAGAGSADVCVGERFESRCAFEGAGWAEWLCTAGCASAGRSFASAGQRHELGRSDAGLATGRADENRQQCAIRANQGVADGSERLDPLTGSYHAGADAGNGLRSSRWSIVGSRSEFVVDCSCLLTTNDQRLTTVLGGHSLKHLIKFVSVGVLLAALESLALCQEARVYREGSNWVQEMTGDLGAAKNLRVKRAAGSVKVQGGSQAGVTYVIHRKAYTSSEPKARHEFESYKINTSVKGDTAWIVAESS